MLLKGNIYIFVEPNHESVLAFMMTSLTEMKPLKKIHYGSKIQFVKEMKAIIPYYA